jgi:3-phosphoshikimate 1-carboxyvinyltransferase
MITVDALRKFGVMVDVDGDTFKIHGGGYAPADVTVEGDWSNAAFLLALGELGGEVENLGLDPESTQGDRIIEEILPRLRSGFAEFDLSDCPDTAPILFAMAAAFGNGARFTGTRRLKIKESDRASAMAEELKKFGAHIAVLEDEVIIDPCEITAPADELCGHNDHRIVMALSVLCTLTGGVIDGAEAVTKSYPNFFEDISSLGLEITYET